MRQRIVQVVGYATALAITRAVVMLLSPLVIAWSSETISAQWSIAISLSPMFSAVLGMGLSTAVVRWYYDHSEKDQLVVLNDFLNLRVVSLVLVGVGLCFFSWIGWGILTGSKIPILPFLPSLAFFGAGESIARFFTSFCRLRNKPGVLVIFRVAHALGAGALAIIFLIFDVLDPFVAFSLGYFLLSIPMMILMYFWAGFGSRFRVPPYLTSVLRFSVPLTFHDLGWWLRGAALTIVVANFETDVVVSAYFLGMLALVPFGVFFSGVDQVFAADFYRDRAAGRDPLNSRRNYTFALILCSIVSCVGIIFCDFYFDPHSGYYDKVLSEVVPIGLLCAVFHGAYVVWVKSLIFAKKTHVLLLGTFTASCLGVAASAIFGSIFGYIGVAYTSLGMFAFMAFYVYLATIVLCDDVMDSYISFSCIFVCCSALFVTFYL